VLTDEAEIHQVSHITIVMPRALNDLTVIKLVTVTERTSRKLRRVPSAEELDWIAGIAKVAMQIVDDLEPAGNQRDKPNDLKKHEKSERPADNPTQHGVGRQGERSADRRSSSWVARAQVCQLESTSGMVGAVEHQACWGRCQLLQRLCSNDKDRLPA
jgi:hypothetical protein